MTVRDIIRFSGRFVTHRTAQAAALNGLFRHGFKMREHPVTIQVQRPGAQGVRIARAPLLQRFIACSTGRIANRHRRLRAQDLIAQVIYVVAIHDKLEQGGSFHGFCRLALSMLKPSLHE